MTTEGTRDASALGRMDEVAGMGLARDVARIIVAELRRADVTPDALHPDAQLVEELGIDSMDLAAIALLLQDEHAIVIDEDEQRKLKTVGEICECIERKLAARQRRAQQASGTGAVAAG